MRSALWGSFDLTGEWHIDPHRIGVLGFSAGAHLAAALSTHLISDSTIRLTPRMV
jgi:acetyl esterase/lipase